MTLARMHSPAEADPEERTAGGRLSTAVPTAAATHPSLKRDLLEAYLSILDR